MVKIVIGRIEFTKQHSGSELMLIDPQESFDEIIDEIVEDLPSSKDEDDDGTTIDVQFTIDDGLPLELFAKIVEAIVEEGFSTHTDFDWPEESSFK